MRLLNDPWPQLDGWLKVLANIQQASPSAILAGGCLRDLAHGVSAKDIDIFVDQYEAPALLLEEQARLTHPEKLNFIDCDVTYQDWSSDVIGIHEFGRDDGQPMLNLIVVRGGTCTVEEQLERFDFGICKVAHDGTDYQVHADYLKDRANRTFTLTRSGTKRQWEQSLKRFERISPRYPGWTLVTPPEPDWDGGLF